MKAMVSAVGGMAMLWAVVAAPVSAQERYALGGDHIAVYNLVGEITVVGTTSGQVTVEVERGGRDSGQLRVESGRLGDVQTLRVIYPSDRIVYSASRWGGTSQLRVRADGTWGGDGPAGRSVRISSRGGGLDAHANLRVGVPRGQRVDLHVGVGRIVAENVNGQVRLQTGSGAIEARGLAGQVQLRTGSGAVRVNGMNGALAVSTGSGRVEVADVSGDSVSIRTGSGRVTADNVVAGQLQVRTGSGRVELRRSAGADVHVNTGSGSVTAELLDPVSRLMVRTGSGGVRLHLSPALDASVAAGTGSGRIELDIPMRITRQARRELRGVIGDGTGEIQISTGSGSIRIGTI